MARLKLLHFGFGAPELFTTQTVGLRGLGDGFENSLRNLASHNGLAYLVSPQIGALWKTLVMLKRPYLKEHKWSGYKNLKNSHFEAFLNFQIEDKSKDQSQIWQQCIGYPGIKLLMLRSSRIKVKFQTQRKFEQTFEQIKGFEATVMQQAFDHLQALDPLMLARDIEIVNPNLKSEHQSSIKSMLFDFVEQKKKILEKGESFNYYKRTPCFNKFRREVIYCISDFYRK